MGGERMKGRKVENTGGRKGGDGEKERKEKKIRSTPAPAFLAEAENKSRN